MSVLGAKTPAARASGSAPKTSSCAWSVGAAEHREIVALCEARDAPGAADALARHLARTAGSMLMHVAPDHEPALMRSAVRAATRTEPAARPARVALQRT